MRTQQSRQSRTSQTMRKGARFLAQEMVREPIKEAVREALRDEAVQVRSAERDDARSGRRDWGSRDMETDDRSRSSRGGSMVSKLGMAMVGLVAILGIRTYMRRKRGGSDQSDRFQSGTAGGYDTGESSEYGASEDRVGTVDRDEPGASSTSSTD